MAKTLDDLMAQTRMLLDESSESDWTDVQITVELNAGYQRIITSVMNVFEDYYNTESSFDLRVNQQEYGASDGVPTNIFKVRRMELNYDIDGGATPSRAFPVNIDSVRRDLGNQSMGKTAFRSAAYYIMGMGGNIRIGLLPIPHKESLGGGIVWYIPYVADMAVGTDEVNIPYPDRYASLIPMYAASMLLKKGQQDMDSSLRLMKDFEYGKQEMEQELEDRIAEESKTIVDVMGENVAFDDFSGI